MEIGGGGPAQQEVTAQYEVLLGVQVFIGIGSFEDETATRILLYTVPALRRWAFANK